jgi:hypothetical protein
MPPPPPAETPLQKHLRRMMEALEEGQKHHERWREHWERQDSWTRDGHGGRDWEKWAEQQARGVEEWAQKQAREVEAWVRHGVPRVEKWADRLEHKHRRKALRREQREARRERERARKEAEKARKERLREEARNNPLHAWVMAIAALVMVGMAFVTPHWWLVFVALGLGSSAAGTLGRARQRRLEQGEAGREASARLPERAEGPREAARAQEDPRRARVDALCDKLLGELRVGPGVLRDVVHQPEQTVEGLRKSCHELARRERELRALSPPEEERRLEVERARLSERVAGETDAVVRERLEKTLRLLDEQRQQRAELATSASRLEAEHMRLYYTLESLYTQVLRVRSADAANADVAGAGLRQSVEQLGLEMEAVASALEEVHGGERGAAPRGRVPTR